ncbi:hypothetical protein AZ78_5200 [Lysobacter capsici AZ78]|uniref:Uncharacterized protein n=1 Tax=Lysobacter capsici AZ78 TaxID=1444315 RepID=A0A125TZI3_9GAMM|nr:hypothetical protein AZ78_5200 [Lysobacter capsici AZ78]
MFHVCSLQKKCGASRASQKARGRVGPAQAGLGRAGGIVRPADERRSGGEELLRKLGTAAGLKTVTARVGGGRIWPIQANCAF